MKSSLSTPDHQWEVKFSSDGSKWRATFRDVSRKKKRVLDLDCLRVRNHEVIRLTSIRHDFAAFWHTSSNATLVDQIIGVGHPSQGDPKDDPKKWRGLRVLGCGDSQNNLIQFQLEKKERSGGAKCQSFLQLLYPPPSAPQVMMMSLNPEGNEEDTPKPMKVPSSAMIIRITVDVR